MHKCETTIYKRVAVECLNICMFQVKVRKGADDITAWQTVNIDGEMFASISNLQLFSYEEYRVELRVTNQAGLTSEVISQSFFVETNKPVDKGKNRYTKKGSASRY